MKSFVQKQIEVYMENNISNYFKNLDDVIEDYHNYLQKNGIKLVYKKNDQSKYNHCIEMHKSSLMALYLADFETRNPLYILRTTYESFMEDSVKFIYLKELLLLTLKVILRNLMTEKEFYKAVSLSKSEDLSTSYAINRFAMVSLNILGSTLFLEERFERKTNTCRFYSFNRHNLNFFSSMSEIEILELYRLLANTVLRSYLRYRNLDQLFFNMFNHIEEELDRHIQEKSQKRKKKAFVNTIGGLV